MPWPNLQPQVIAVHSASAVEYTRVMRLTPLNGTDITSDLVQICLGTETMPGAFVTPDTVGSASLFVRDWVKQGGRNPNDLPDGQLLYQRSASLLIGGSLQPAIGSYWVWMVLGVGAQTIPRRGFKVIIT